MLATQTMTTAQAAVYLNVSPRTVQRLVADGELTALMKLPGRTGAYVFDAATVRAYKAAQPARELETWRALAISSPPWPGPVAHQHQRQLTGSAGTESVPKPRPH